MNSSLRCREAILSLLCSAFAALPGVAQTGMTTSEESLRSDPNGDLVGVVRAGVPLFRSGNAAIRGWRPSWKAGCGRDRSRWLIVASTISSLPPPGGGGSATGALRSRPCPFRHGSSSAGAGAYPWLDPGTTDSLDLVRGAQPERGRGAARHDDARPPKKRRPRGLGRAVEGAQRLGPRHPLRAGR